MKKVFLLFFILVISVTEAKVWRVDNNATNKPDFTNLQLAYDGASAGDTLYIAGHANSYGNLGISKRIVIIGAGYFSEQNLEKGVNPFDARIEQLSFSIGAENSVIISCNINYVIILCNNIILKRNLIPNVVETNGQGLSGSTIHQCFITGLTLRGDNFVVTNNVIGSLYVSSSGLVKNNVIRGSANINGVIFENNVFLTDHLGNNNSIMRNNVNTNDFNSVFINTGAEDAKYILKDGSPAKGAGVNGVDCGIFGGDEPYILSGIPPIPTIYEAIVPSTVTNKDGLPVKIKAKANN
jgi:hypothetical protein